MPTPVKPAMLMQADQAKAAALEDSVKALLTDFRKIIVLLADEAKLTEQQRAHTTAVGQELFHQNQARGAALEAALAALVASNRVDRYDILHGLLEFIESDKSLYDADRLAFRDLLQALLADVARDSSLPAIKLHKRISEDVDALAEIERNYEKEIRQIFGRYEQRSIELKREKWDAYVAYLKTLHSREAILKEHGVVLAYPPRPAQPAAGAPGKEESGEIFGVALPPKTVVLTFDDGPHKRYSEEIAAILKQYNVPAVFFNVGTNLGTVGTDGKATLNAGADISRKLSQAGYVLANHSYTHAQLSKQTGDKLKAEILNADLLLKAVDKGRSELFRFPYGARNSEGLNALAGAKLRSVMWNIDSLDWADPVPSSIAERVLRTVDKEGRGIILFHDIHARTVKALPAILERLIAAGYQFAGWDGTTFKTAKGNATRACRAGQPGLCQLVGDRDRHRRLCKVAQASLRRARRARGKQDADRQIRFRSRARGDAGKCGSYPQRYPGRFPQ